MRSIAVLRHNLNHFRYGGKDAMSKIIFANKLQHEVLNSDARITVVTAQAGAGSTVSLVLKAIKSCNEEIPSWYQAAESVSRYKERC